MIVSTSTAGGWRTAARWTPAAERVCAHVLPDRTRPAKSSPVRGQPDRPQRAVRLSPEARRSHSPTGYERQERSHGGPSLRRRIDRPPAQSAPALLCSWTTAVTLHSRVPCNSRALRCGAGFSLRREATDFGGERDNDQIRRPPRSSQLVFEPEEGVMSELPLDAAGRRRSPATMPGVPHRSPAARQGPALPGGSARQWSRSSKSCALPATGGMGAACAA